jgi:NADP-dependent 3-hydroxy acid dehydrogenase YdfG
VVIQARRKEPLEELAAEIATQGGSVLAVTGDAGVANDVDALMERALSWEEGGHKIDIVVINAGRGLAGGLLTSDESQWQELYQNYP